MLTDNDRKEIDERIANQLEAMSIVDLIGVTDERDREEIAGDISRFMFDRQQALRSPKNTYTPRYLLRGQDINNRTYGSYVKADQAGHMGPTLPRIVNLDDGFEARIDEKDSQQLNIRGAGSGSDCQWDYIVSTCFATLPGFTEGKFYRSLSGCEFRGYSTIAGAMTAIDALGTGDSSTVLICHGTYAEQFSVPSTLNSSITIIGSGIDNTIIKPPLGSSIAAIAVADQSAHNNVVVMEHFTVDSTNMDAGSWAIVFSDAAHFILTKIKFAIDSSSQGLRIDAAIGVSSILAQCIFEGGGKGIQPTTAQGSSQWLIVDACDFISNSIGIDLTTGDMALQANNCTFNNCTIGLDISGNLPGEVSVSDSTFFNNTDGVKISNAAGGGLTQVIGINDNLFYNCTDGVDLDTASGPLRGITVEGNRFRGSSSDIGIRLDATLVQDSIILGNTFMDYTANNEIVGITEAQALTANLQIVHNTSDSAAVLPDTHALALGGVLDHGTLTGLEDPDHDEIADADGDTGFESERTADDDTAWIRAGGVDQANATSARFKFLDMIAWPDATTLTVASGAVTVTTSHHTIAGEGAADDELDTINGNIDVGWLMLKRAAQAITLTTAGNVVFADGGGKRTLTDTKQYFKLWYNPTLSKWVATLVGEHFTNPDYETLTISGGAITVTPNPGVIRHYLLLPEGGLEDELETINGGIPYAWIFIRRADTDPTINITNNDNIHPLTDSHTYAMNEENEGVLLYYDDDSSNWAAIPNWNRNSRLHEVGGSNGVIVSTEEGHTVIEKQPVTFSSTDSEIVSDQFLQVHDNIFRIDVEGGAAASDDLDGLQMEKGLNDDPAEDGDWCIVSPVSGSRDIIIRHNNAGGDTGAKIFCQGGTDITLDDLHDFCLFVYNSSLDSGNGGWMAGLIGGGGSGSGDVATDVIWDAAGDLAVGTGANTAARLAISIPGAANLLNVPGVINGETTLSYKAVFDATVPSAIGTASAGTGVIAARVNHIHAADSDDVAYVPASNDDWGGSDPGDVEQALDVAAARTSKGREVIYAPRFRGNVYRTSPVAPAEAHDTGSEDNFEQGVPFPNSGTTYATAEMMLPANYKPNTAFTMRFIWTALTGSGDIEWGVRAVCISEGDTLNAAMGTTAVKVDTLTTANDIHLSDTVSMTAAGTPAANDWMILEVIRNAADADDTLSATAYLKAVEITWDNDGTGGYA